MVSPTTSAQVSQAIDCANKFNVKVATRSGGHSYSANGLGGADGSLVIDVKNFNRIVLNKATGIATVGAGARLGDIATELYERCG